MNQVIITPQDKEDIAKFFGVPLEQLDLETFKKTLRQLRAKYHPDNFEKFEDPTIKEVMTEKFQLIERLAAKLEQFFQGNIRLGEQTTGMARPEKPLFAFDEMKIEIITADKDLKYHLFGAYYRWLKYGERFKIPETGASIIVDEDHAGLSIGFRESVRMYLTFGTDDSIEAIVGWLYEKIRERATSLLIEGKMIPVTYESMVNAIQRISLLSAGQEAV